MDAQEKDATPPTPQDPEAERIDRLRNAFLGGIAWFYWIGGLSLINIAMIAAVDRRFIIGLGLTDFFAGTALEAVGPMALFWLALAAAGSFLLIWAGFQGRKGKRAYILAGLLCYALDAGMLLLVEEYLSVAFHAFAAFRIGQGYFALKRILSEGQRPGTIFSSPLPPEILFGDQDSYRRGRHAQPEQTQHPDRR